MSFPIISNSVPAEKLQISSEFSPGPPRQNTGLSKYKVTVLDAVAVAAGLVLNVAEAVDNCVAIHVGNDYVFDARPVELGRMQRRWTTVLKRLLCGSNVCSPLNRQADASQR